MTSPTPKSNAENTTANFQFMMKRLKTFESQIVYSTGRLFVLFSRLEDDLQKQDMVHKEEIRVLKREVAKLKEAKENAD